MTDEMRRRLDVAISIARNEAESVDTSSLRSEGMRFAFEKMHQQWMYVRDVLVMLRDEPRLSFPVTDVALVAAWAALHATKGGDVHAAATRLLRTKEPA